MPEKPKAPDTCCVTVSTAEKPVYNRVLDGPPYLAVSKAEREAVRYLVKECGWYWIDAGVLRRHRFIQEAA
tara:strand:- start:377 stop:589 length:213 start_codon:yes stop_codon:yes gene_type:complete